MIDHLLQPLICERFIADARYRKGHLRVVNAFPKGVYWGLHLPEIKQIAKRLAREGGEVVLPDGTCQICINGTEETCCRNNIFFLGGGRRKHLG